MSRLTSPLRALAAQEVQSLWNQSVVFRYLSWLRFGRWRPADDKVAVLRHDALGMFLYNQRALTFATAGLLLVGIALAQVASPMTEVDHRAAVTLTIVWLTGVACTLALHRGFRRQLQAWANSRVPVPLPAMFDVYFILDSVLLWSAIAVDRKYGTGIDVLALLLAANTVVYGAYVLGADVIERARIASLLLLLLIAITALSTLSQSHRQPTWFGQTLLVAAFVGAIIVTLFSTGAIAWIKRNEQQRVTLRLMLLGRYEQLLGSAAVPASMDEAPSSDRQFRRVVRGVLSDLCGHKDSLWYRSACLWRSEHHLDRGTVYFPAISVAVPEVRDYMGGVRTKGESVVNDEVVVLRSLEGQAQAIDRFRWRFRFDQNIPAAYVPLRRHGVDIGALVIYGTETGPSVSRQDEPFLRTLGTILVNVMEQWESRFRIVSQRELDDLFECSNLEDVFQKAVTILQKHLMAEGCEIIFREQPTINTMKLVAASGFSDAIFKGRYEVGRGQTGLCAELRKPIRIDDVPAHGELFDPEGFALLERAHGRPVTSWMAIPIGEAHQNNYGVIKVVNSTGRSNWFTASDESLGRTLGLRLHVLIEKFLHLRATEQARKDAEKSAHDAEVERAKFEKLAAARHQELMNITHQLQGPLISVVGALSLAAKQNLSRLGRSLVEHAQDLVEDALALGYGTFTTLASEAGHGPPFAVTEIDARLEMEKLATRLQRTNDRRDLRFDFQQDIGFPKLKLDRHAFTSVMYSLIHNAMKYADRNSEVVLACGFEGSHDEPALKVKSLGEPIHPSERELIFHKFYRGRSVERGRRHSGVGLGLWVARELMRQLKGDLTVELSLEYQRLSVFVVWLPEGVAG